MTPREKIYAERRNAIERDIFDTIWSLIRAHHLAITISDGIDGQGGLMDLQNIEAQHVYMRFSPTNPEEFATVGLVIGHFGDDWQVFVTVSTPGTPSMRFVDDGDTSAIVAYVEAQIKRIYGLS